MKIRLLLLICLIPVSGESFEIWRGIENGASCQEIIAVEERLGSEMISKNKSSLIAFRGKHGNLDAVVVYSCLPDRWSQSIDYGLLERGSATIEQKKLTNELEIVHGSPILDIESSSMWARLMVFVEFYFNDVQFYYELMSTKMWAHGDLEISSFITHTPPLLDKTGKLWSVSYSKTARSRVSICDKSDCQKVKMFTNDN
jgi:hypothetical protein